MRYYLACLGMASLLFVACGSDDSDPVPAGQGQGGSGQGGSGQGGSGQAGTGGTAPSNGITPCGNFPDQQPKSCIAGQYCEDEIFSKCSDGCLSDTNCTSAQMCVKTGTNVGSCQAKPAGKDCAAYIAKCNACGGTPQECSQQACDALSADCVACIVDSNCGQGCESKCGL